MADAGSAMRPVRDALIGVGEEGVGIKVCDHDLPERCRVRVRRHRNHLFIVEWATLPEVTSRS